MGELRRRSAIPDLSKLAAQLVADVSQLDEHEGFLDSVVTFDSRAVELTGDDYQQLCILLAARVAARAAVIIEGAGGGGWQR